MPLAGSFLTFFLVRNFPVRSNNHHVAGDRGDFPGIFGHQNARESTGDPFFQAGGDIRGLGDEQRHGLALHVRTHQGAVGVSCSQNGIKLAATETNCLGETSM